MMLWTVRRITVYRIWADFSLDCLQAKKETAFAVSFFVPEWVPCQGPPLAALVFAQQNRRTKREETSFRMSLFFCDCPHVLLSALPPTARKGECEGGTFDGFPHSRSVTRPQATGFAQQNRRTLLQKKRRAAWRVSFFGAGYGSRTRLNGLGSRCNTDIPTLRFTYRVIVAYRRRFCNRKLCRKGMNVLSRRIPIEKSLEGTL